MCRWAVSISLFLLVCLSVSAQTIDIKGAKESETPTYRPILLGTGPNALINRIDTGTLIQKGQKDGLIMFTCMVNKLGKMVESATYRGSPDSDALEQELRRRLADAIFIPAIYNHLPVDAVYYGTVTFVVVEGKPRLRIFSNQEYDELRKESDFIGPQPFFGDGSKFNGVHYPSAASETVPVSGIADVKMKIDENGNLQSMTLVGEHPPLLDFGAAALGDLHDAKFIPAFRQGKPVSCEVTLPVYYPEPF
jgi:Gram-negative bacterial TonB protein C-terminal